MKNTRHYVRHYVRLMSTAAAESETVWLAAPTAAPPGAWGEIEYRFGRTGTPLYIHRYDGLCDRRGFRRFYLGRHWMIPHREKLFLRSEWAALHGERRLKVLYDTASNSLCRRPTFDMKVPWVEPNEALWPALAEFGENELPVFALDRIGEVDPGFWEAITAPAEDTVLAFLREKNK